MPNLLHHPSSGVFTAITVDLGGDSRLRPAEDLGARAAIASRLFGEHATPVMIGRFRVTRRLGIGGMGRVYEAIDEELDRRVALKLLAEPDHDGGAARERMVREARSLARLSHPNVVQIFDVGEHEGSIFLAMEYVDGQSLLDWQEKAQRWRAVLDKYLQAGEGLIAVHATGLVHRDFKPANVLIDGRGRVKVADFGVALVEASAATTQSDRITDPDPSWSGSMRLTQTGATLGTPAYMSPEQQRASAIDARSDQYSFCVALWEAVFGARPYASARHREGDAKLEPGPRHAPGWLRAVLLRGLELRPDDRWRDMEALLAALRGGAARRRAIAVGACVIASAGAIAVASAWLARPSCDDAGTAIEAMWNDAEGNAVREAFRRTEMPFAATSAETSIAQLDEHAARWVSSRLEVCRAHRLEHVRSAEFYDASMACLDRRLEELGGVVDRLADIDAGGAAHAQDVLAMLTPMDACLDPDTLRDVAPSGADDGALRSRVLEARLELALGRSAAALAGADAAIERARELQAERMIAEGMAVRAHALEQLERWPEAETAYFEAVRLAEATHHDELVVEVWRRMAGFDAFRQQRASAEKWLVLLDGAVRRIGDPPRARGRYLTIAGVVAGLRKDPTEKERLLRGALVQLEAAGEADGPEALEAMRQLANALADQHRTDEAEELYLRAQAITRERWGEDHPHLGALEFNLGYLAHDRKDYPRALAHAERAVQIYSRFYGDESEHTSSHWSMIAKLRHKLGDADGAREAARHAIAAQRNMPPNHSERVSGLGLLANIEKDTGNRVEALALYRQVLELGLPKPEMRAVAEYNVAELLCALEACAGALPHLERAALEAPPTNRRLADDIAKLRAYAQQRQHRE